MTDKPDPPAAPDPVRVAQAQTQSNEATARTEANLNRVNQRTPYGDVTYSNTGDRWTQTTTESPNQRALRESQERTGIALGDLANNQVGRVDDLLSQPFNPESYSTQRANGGPLDLSEAMGGDFDSARYDPTAALGNFGDDVESRTFDLATKGLDREFDRSEESLRSRMANQGLTQGSDAFDAEMRTFDEGKGQAFTNAMLQSRDAALKSRGQAATELGQGFTQGLAGRTQDMAEILSERGVNASEGEADWARGYGVDLAKRQVPLSEITSIMSGTPLTPINPGAASSTSVGQTDVLGAEALAYRARENAYNQNMAGRNAIIGGIAGLGGAALGAGIGG